MNFSTFSFTWLSFCFYWSTYTISQSGRTRVVIILCCSEPAVSVDCVAFCMLQRRRLSIVPCTGKTAYTWSAVNHSALAVLLLFILQGERWRQRKHCPCHRTLVLTNWLKSRLINLSSVTEPGEWTNSLLFFHLIHASGTSLKLSAINAWLCGAGLLLLLCV